MCKRVRAFQVPRAIIVCSHPHDRAYWKNKRNQGGRGWGMTRKPKKGR